MLYIGKYSMEVIKFSVKMVHFLQCGGGDKLVHFKFIAIKRHKILQFTHQLGAFHKESMLSCLKCN